MEVIAARHKVRTFRTGKTWGRRIEEPILRFLLWMFTRVDVEGLELMPRSGPLIIILNHVHWLDPVIMVAKAPRYVVPIAKVEALSYPFLGLLLRWYPVIPIHRGQVDLRAIRRARAELAAGSALLIEPEGTRSKSGALQPAQPGFVYLARHPGTVIQPAGISGTVALSQYVHRLRRCPIKLRLGQPFRLRLPAGRVSREDMQHMADEAMYRVAHLLPPAMRGVYTDLDRATAHFLDFDLG